MIFKSHTFQPNVYPKPFTTLRAFTATPGKKFHSNKFSIPPQKDNPRSHAHPFHTRHTTWSYRRPRSSSPPPVHHRRPVSEAAAVSPVCLALPSSSRPQAYPSPRYILQFEVAVRPAPLSWQKRWSTSRYALVYTIA